MADAIFRQLAAGIRGSKDTPAFLQAKPKPKPATTATVAAPAVGAVDFFADPLAAAAPQHAHTQKAAAAAPARAPAKPGSASSKAKAPAAPAPSKPTAAATAAASSDDDDSDAEVSSRRLSVFASGKRPRPAPTSDDDDDDDSNDGGAAGRRASSTGASSSAASSLAATQLEAMRAFKKRMLIKTSGTGCPPPLQTFDSLPLLTALPTAWASSGGDGDDAEGGSGAIAFPTADVGRWRDDVTRALAGSAVGTSTYTAVAKALAALPAAAAGDAVGVAAAAAAVGSGADAAGIAARNVAARRSVLSNVDASAYKEPTPIQMQSLACMLGGRDVLGIAPTGSGKTAAFSLPSIMLLQGHDPLATGGIHTRVAVSDAAGGSAGEDDAGVAVSLRGSPRAIVLVPVKELAHQTCREITRLSKGTGLRVAVLTAETATGAAASASAQEGAAGGAAAAGGSKRRRHRRGDKTAAGGGRVSASGDASDLIKEHRHRRRRGRGSRRDGDADGDDDDGEEEEEEDDEEIASADASGVEDDEEIDSDDASGGGGGDDDDDDASADDDDAEDDHLDNDDEDEDDPLFAYLTKGKGAGAAATAASGKHKLAAIGDSDSDDDEDSAGSDTGSDSVADAHRRGMGHPRHPHGHHAHHARSGTADKGGASAPAAKRRRVEAATGDDVVHVAADASNGIVVPALPHCDILVTTPLTLVAALRHAQHQHAAAAAATSGSAATPAAGAGSDDEDGAAAAPPTPPAPLPRALLPSLRLLICDEADKLLEEGFAEQVDEILAARPDSESVGAYVQQQCAAAVAAARQRVAAAAGAASSGKPAGKTPVKTTTGTGKPTPKALLAPLLATLAPPAAGGAGAAAAAPLPVPPCISCLFTATMPSGIEELASAVTRDHIRITIGTRGTASTNIDQKLVFVGREDGKLLAMRQLIAQGLKPPVLIFVQSKERARELTTALRLDGANADAIHADRSDSEREDAVKRFRRGQLWYLVATEILGRGMDFKSVSTVINYDMPTSAVAYIHRIGRTGRAGRAGTAITLFTEDDVPMLRSIANVMKLSGSEVPGWMLQLKKMDRNEAKRLQHGAVRRRAIYRSDTKYDRAVARREREAAAGGEGGGAAGGGGGGDGGDGERGRHRGRGRSGGSRFASGGGGRGRSGGRGGGRGRGRGRSS